LTTQVLWTSPSDLSCTARDSASFNLRADGHFHEYQLTFDSPVYLTVLRFDPHDKAVEQIRLAGLSLLNSDGIEIQSFHGAEGFAQWTEANCRRQTSAEFLELTPIDNGPLRNDIHLVSPQFQKMLEVKEIRIQMAAIRKTPMLQWIFSLSL
jgi:hypothetical protein